MHKPEESIGKLREVEVMLARKPRMLVTVALANKMARTVWALLVRHEDYRALVAVAV